MRVTWIVRYQCGCTDDAPRKRDLLEYCGKHGGDAVEWFKVPKWSAPATPTEEAR